jgi:hypothetical protein
LESLVDKEHLVTNLLPLIEGEDTSKVSGPYEDTDLKWLQTYRCILGQKSFRKLYEQHFNTLKCINLHSINTKFNSNDCHLDFSHQYINTVKNIVVPEVNKLK